ncbi:uncharacterized protein LOC130648773 isoform X2 [Hydractinia symbiolongicarpus]|uniref:uncharacterized protein LOC130648773 isoform X2 n=1 Tax=Hydractinia symbiolongicarpus TaxID=13093 RepID=UPI00254D2BC2|nr:uncharacterized protein LOC130648773 isoform X2 [Hydractinia symbiolongicarpus]
MVLLVRDKVPYLGLKSLKLIKTNEELRYDYGDKCMLSLRKQKNLCVPLHLKDIENQLKKISHASILKLKEGQKTVIEVEGEHTYNEKYNLLSINVYCDTIIFIVLKQPYMIIRDRENLFKPLIYKTKIPNLHFEKGCLFEIDKEITRHDSCDTRPQDVADDRFCECCKIRYTSLQHVLA